MAVHIQEFTIHAYRGIKELTISGLKSINILTGDNNSGKTSVLEILSTLNNPQDIGTWYPSARVNTRVIDRRIYNGFYNMFPIDDEYKTIYYDFMDKNKKINSIKLQADIKETQMLEKEMYRLNGLIKTGSSKTEDEVVDVECMTLKAYINEKLETEYNIYDFQKLISRFVSKKARFINTVYVSPANYTAEEWYLDTIFSDIELYEELIEILREFDSDIISINAAKKSASSAPEYMILSQKHKKALPLNVYGDGMKKAVLLLSALLRARNGILLLDEFETAIHTSAMDSIFSWLLKSAIKLNVQVFLTSHSKEAIEKILKSGDELQQHINLYTLYNYEGQNLVRKMGCAEAINAQENLGLELR